MKIITLTLNPAFDIHCHVKNFQSFHENIAKITSTDAGGKGVNISRALKNNGINNTVVIVAGKDNASEFTASIKNDNVLYCLVETDGRIRQNITVHSGNEDAETRISFNGFVCDNVILNEVGEKIGCVDSETIITMTGSIPDGVSVSAVKEFLSLLKKQGAKIVIDSRSFSLADICEFKPWLIKPNKDEIEKYTSKKIEMAADALQIAKKLNKEGVENVIISFGGMGAALSCKEGDFLANAPEIRAVSTIGAGESMIAGFIPAYINVADAPECLKNAVAFGTAACLAEGTRPPEPSEVKKLKTLIRITGF